MGVTGGQNTEQQGFEWAQGEVLLKWSGWHWESSGLDDSGGRLEDQSTGPQDKVAGGKKQHPGHEQGHKK